MECFTTSRFGLGIPDGSKQALAIVPWSEAIAFGDVASTSLILIHKEPLTEEETDMFEMEVYDSDEDWWCY